MISWALGFSTENQQAAGQAGQAAVQAGFQVHSFLVSFQFKVKLSCEMVQQ